MPVLSIVCVTLSALWLALVIAAQLLAPEQSALSMGMSGLAVGPHGWAMKAAFAARGSAACVLAAGLPGALLPGWRLTAGFVLFWVWGVGSVLLAVWDTDMPGDAPSRHGRAHVLIALVAYLAARVAVIVLSPALPRLGGTAGTAPWAMPLAIAAAVFMVLQFVAFGQQARAAAAGGSKPHGEGAAASPPAASGLGAYAGLLQRVFIGLIMVWTVLAAVSF
jgi:hypothetical protein